MHLRPLRWRSAVYEMADASPTPLVVIYEEKYWGLDPLFRSHCKFYISDVVNLAEAPDKPGVFFYLNHPLLRVDIMGVVVKVIRRQRVIVYAVDDGTGVINCVYWLPTDSETSRGKQGLQDLADVIGGNLQESIRQLEEEMEMLSDGLDLGDLIQVRGKLKSYRGMREVMAKYIRKVVNPTEEASRMLELPHLYETCYDLPFCPPPEGRDGGTTAASSGSTGHNCEDTVVKDVAMAILSHINLEHIEITSLHQWLEGDLWEASIASCLQGTDKPTASRLVSNALESLEQDGHLVKKHGSKQEYLVSSQSTSLASAILDILRRDCPTPKYAVTGCHYLHVRDELRKQLTFANATKNATRLALDRLEERSDVISITDSHYMLFS